MENKFYSNVYNPDVLSCIANLSSDEVFTSPNVVNDMLDLLPQELFTNPATTFLDPACKSGVFLREIAKRLLKGLEKEIPDLQERIDHIFHNQLFAISITELTSLLSRRSVYCSKFPNSKYSVSKFDNDMGNIIFNRIEHTWENGRCIFCGADKNIWDRGDDFETHAYQFIHTKNPEEIFNMNFDVIIGNPPYQLSDGGGTGSSARPLYHLFVEQAIKIKPRYISMIIPSRWFTGGKGLNEFRDAMLEDKRISVLHDYVDSKDCFQGVDIKGGICYFLWSRDYAGKCDYYLHDNNGTEHSNRYLKTGNNNTLIRYDKCISIVEKVIKLKEDSFSEIVSSRKPYGLPSDFLTNPTKYKFPKLSNNFIKDGITIYGLEKFNRTEKYAPSDYPINIGKESLNKYKIFIPKAYGCGAIGEEVSTPILGTPMTCCTETFLQIGSFKSEKEAKNCLSYIKTKFLRLLVGIKKTTQNSSTDTYSLVPIQDFNESWTDEKLYKKYKLTKEEISFIESMIKPMDDNAENGGKDE